MTVAPTHTKSQSVQLPSTAAEAAEWTLPRLRTAGRALVEEWTTATRSLIPLDTTLLDAHCHVGVDLDGSQLSANDLLSQLDNAGVSHATVIALHQSAGYLDENRRMRAIAEASGGRLFALHRIDPALDGHITDDARAALASGARGLKWHPRAEAFEMSNPAAAATASVAAEAEVPILIHAGRGMPQLGAQVVNLARQFPSATFILAHAAISDVAWIAPAAAELPNVTFDTSWWKPWDLAVLMSRVPSSQLIFGSDPPYGTVAMGLQYTARIARACGYDDDEMRSLLGGAASRLLKVGPSHQSAADTSQPAIPASHSLPIEDPDLRRAASYLESSLHLIFVKADATETIDLARVSLQVPSSHTSHTGASIITAALNIADELLSRAPQDSRRGSAMKMPLQVAEAVELLVCALIHASTSSLGIAGEDMLNSA